MKYWVELLGKIPIICFPRRISELKVKGDFTNFRDFWKRFWKVIWDFSIAIKRFIVRLFKVFCKGAPVDI